MNPDSVGLTRGAGGVIRVEAAGIGHDLLLALVALNLLLVCAVLLLVWQQASRSSAGTSAGTRAWQRWLGIGVGAGIGILFLWQVRDLLTPFLIAFFLASLLDPVVTNLQKRGVSRARAVGSIFTLALVLFALALVLIVPRAKAEMEDLAENAASYSQGLSDRATQFYNGLPAFVRTHVPPPAKFLDARSPAVAAATQNVLEKAKNALFGLAGKALWLIIIPLSLVFFLLDYPNIRARIISLCPPRHRASIDTMSAEVVGIFGQYIRSLAKVCALYGVCAALIFYWLGVRHALFLGIAAGVFYAVPYVGPALTTIAASVISLTMNPVQIYPTHIVLQPTLYAILVVGCFIVMHVTFDYVITPRVVGGSVGLHPLVNIFALMCGATLFGVWGMLLAVPVAASVQMLLLYFFPKLGDRPACAPLSTTAPPESLASILPADEPLGSPVEEAVRG